MPLVIFRSRLRSEHLDAYQTLAPEILELARSMPGFQSFKSFTAEDGERVSLIEFASEETLAAWRNHPDHIAAQQRGKDAFYAEYRIQVCEVVRDYGSQQE